MGNEFRVNGYQNNWQRDADIATFRDGSFVIVYESYVNNYDDGPSATVVMQQRFDAQGRFLGDEEIVDGSDGSSSEDARVTTLSDGGYVVVFTFDNYDDILSTDDKVFAKVYNADGNARTGAIRVDNFANPDAEAVLPAAVATANGGFRVVFGGERAGPGVNGIEQVYSRAFDRNGNAIEARPALLNVNEGQFDQIYAHTVQLANGRSVAVWNSEGSFEIGTDLDSNEVRGTIFGPGGNPIRRDFHLTDNIGTVGFGGDGRGYNVGALNNGGFAISHLGYGSDIGSDVLNIVRVRLFDDDGRATTRAITVHRTEEVAYDTAVTQLASGEIVVVWEQYSETRGDSDFDIYGRILSSSGRALSGVFEVGQDRFDGDSQEDPEIAALAGGGFVVTYTSDSIDADNDGVAARIFGRGGAGDDRIGVDATGTMAGLGGNDVITGNGRANALFGNAGDDRLAGLGGADRLVGGTGTDVLEGGAGRDRLEGGAGADRMAGGAGADRFVFASRPDAVDRIEGFNDADRILLEGSVFRGTGGNGTLDARAFKVLGQGVDGSDRILYDRRDGILYYDPDGSGPRDRVAFADLGNDPRLTYGDFLVV